ncbi:MAG: hypothetical protein Tsb009_21490 [Planctomycetaceae bacterium]
MRHRMRGRKLGRNASHRKAMFKNMANSLIKSVRVDEDDPNRPKFPGRITTTLPKAKELRPIVEKLVTLAKKAAVHSRNAEQYATTAERNSEEWRSWRESEQWNQWNQAIAPAVALRRRAFAELRDNEAVDILFDELAERFADRPGGYTRVVRIAAVRLGDAGQQAIIEFVGERDRVKTTRQQAPMVVDDEPEAAPAEESAETNASEESAATETEESTEAPQTDEEASAEENSGEESASEEETEKPTE